ncbi:MAG: OadG family protein [Clostridia bacterium]|nr:OadG family protein [Clostridia bacterium]
MEKFLEVLSVAGIGMGTVFVGLICLVGICKLIGLVVSKLPQGKGKKETKEEPPVEIPNRQEFIAAVSAAIAEELGEDVRAIRITSVRRI